MELKPCPGCGQLLQQDGKTPQGIIWRHPVIPEFCPLVNVVFCGEQFSVRWQALPRASGGLEGAIEVVEAVQSNAMSASWTKRERHAINAVLNDAKRTIRSLPDSGEVGRLREAVRRAGRHDDECGYWRREKCDCEKGDETLRQALAGPKP